MAFKPGRWMGGWLLVDNPLLFPGQCVDGSQGEAFDTGVELMGGYHVYVSTREVKQAVRDWFGMVDYDDHERLQQETQELRDQIVVLESKLIDAQPRLDAFEQALARYGEDGGDDVPVQRSSRPSRTGAKARGL